MRLVVKTGPRSKHLLPQKYLAIKNTVLLLVLLLPVSRVEVGLVVGVVMLLVCVLAGLKYMSPKKLNEGEQEQPVV